MRWGNPIGRLIQWLQNVRSAASGPVKSRHIAAVALFILAAQVLGFHSLRHDDAFITYRYGQNLVLGRGLTFNPGDRQMVSTSPGHVLLSAAVYRVADQELTPSVMSALGCVGWTAQAWAVFVLARAAFPSLGALFIALGVALGAAWSQRFVGLETNLAAAAVLWALAASLHQRFSSAAVLTAVAGLLRPDAFLVGLVIAVPCIRTLGWRAWKPVVTGISVCIPWYLFAAFYFGDVIPTSFDVKVDALPLLPYAAAAGKYVAASIVLPRPELELPPLIAPGVPEGMVLVLSVVVWLLGVLGAWSWIRRRPDAWALPATGLLYLGAYLILRAEIGIEWHLYPVMLVLAVMVLAALAHLVTWSTGRAQRTVSLVVLATVLLGLTWRTSSSACNHSEAFWFGARHGVYRTMAHDLLRRGQPNEVIWTNEVGTLAYYTDMRTLDGGLVRDDPRGTQPVPPRWLVTPTAYPIPCPSRPVMRAVSKLTFAGELRPRGHHRFVATLCDLHAPKEKLVTSPGPPIP